MQALEKDYIVCTRHFFCLYSITHSELEMGTGRAASGPGLNLQARGPKRAETGLKIFHLWYTIVCGNACQSMFPASVLVLLPSFCPIEKVQGISKKNSWKLIGMSLKLLLTGMHSRTQWCITHKRTMQGYPVKFILVFCSLWNAFNLSWHFLKFNF